MHRRALPSFALVFALGLGALVVLGLAGDRTQAFTLGVRADAPAVKLPPGGEVCQRPIEVLEEFDRVQLQIGTFSRRPSTFALRVRRASGGAPLAAASVDGGYRDAEPQSVRLPAAIAPDEDIAVCIRNDAGRAIAVYGSSDLSNRTSTAYLKGRRTGTDLMLVFETSDGKGMLELLPAVIRRASLFHGEWASPAAYWVLLALLLGALAVFPALALRAAFRGFTADE